MSKVLGLLLAAAIAAISAGAGPGLVGDGSLVDHTTPIGPSVSHGWVVAADPTSRAAMVLHLPPRGLFSERDGRVIGAHAGEARAASALLAMPVAIAARGDELAMAFVDPNGIPQTGGRTLLRLAAVPTGPGVWDTTPKGRLDALPSLRGDGMLLGLAGADAGYCALYQGLIQNGADPKKLVLQMLCDSTWSDVPLPAELQFIAQSCYSIGANNRPATSARWQLFPIPGGIALLVVPPTAADGLLGTLLTAQLAPPPAPGKPLNAPLWRSEDITLPVPGIRTNASAAGVSGHLVITAMPDNGAAELHVFTRPLAFPDLGWREIATLPHIAQGHALVPLSGVRRIAVVSEPVPVHGQTPAGELQTMTELSVGTGQIFYSGDMVLISPISQSDYRMVGVMLAYALGLVIIFLAKAPSGDAIILPEGYTIAEPGRRVVAGIVDLVVGLVLAARLWNVPVAEILTPSSWTSESGQVVLLTAVGILIILCTLLEVLFGKSVGRILTGCQIVSVRFAAPTKPDAKPVANATPADAQQPPPNAGKIALWRLLLRNFIKWGLPPVALLGLLDPAGRHRGDQLARTAIVVEAIPDDELDGDDEDPEA